MSGPIRDSMLNADFFTGDREMTINDAVKCNLSSLSCLEVEKLPLEDLQAVWEDGLAHVVI